MVCYCWLKPWLHVQFLHALLFNYFSIACNSCRALQELPFVICLSLACKNCTYNHGLIQTFAVAISHQFQVMSIFLHFGESGVKFRLSLLPRRLKYRRIRRARPSRHHQSSKSSSPIFFWGIGRQRVAVAKLSEALAWHSGGKMRTFARETRVQNLAMAHTGTGRLWACSYMPIGVVNEYPPSFGAGEGKAATERR